MFKDALHDLLVMSQHVRVTFDKAVGDYRAQMPKKTDSRDN